MSKQFDLHELQFGKYGSNPQGIREILDGLFEFDNVRATVLMYTHVLNCQ